jgi:Ca-activated chloride channel homolog
LSRRCGLRRLAVLFQSLLVIPDLAKFYGMFLKFREFSFLLVVVIGATALLPAVSFSRNKSNQDIRIDVPDAARVRIDNPFGAIAATVWKEKYVSVAAAIEGGAAAFRRSPIVIDNRNQLLLISVVRTPLDPPAAISLTVKLPDSVQVEMSTGAGALVIHGLPASASLKSVSGDIRADLTNPLDADISARSVSGIIRSELAATLSAGGHLLQTREGNGVHVLRINTDRGSIILNQPAVALDQPAARRDPPRLAGVEPSEGAGTPATSAETEEISEGDIIRVDSQLTTLNVSVVERNTSRGVMGLTQRDFELLEDGTRQEIVQFESSEAPFDLVLLIDVSGSTRDKVKLIRAAALRFVAAARPSDRIAIISFAGQPTLVSPFTLNRELLRQRVEGIDTATGDTKVYDAIEFALKQIPAGTIGSRRTALVLMSDGLDGSMEGVQGDGSQVSYNEVLGHVREFDGVLYSLWLNTEYEALSPLDTQPEAFDQSHERMKGMAEAGGGAFYEVDRLEDLAGSYERVVADLGTVYSLSYRPTNKARDGKWRTIRVNVARPAAVARGKHGYFAN